MSSSFSIFIRNFITNNDLNISALENHIETSNLTALEFCNSCINCFLELNFTGPLDLDVEANVTVSNPLLSQINEELICEGEIPFSKTKGIILLWMAKCISKKASECHSDAHVRFKFCIVFLQCIYLHKSTMRDHVSAKLSAQVDNCLAITHQLKDAGIQAIDEFQLFILASYLSLTYYKYDVAQTFIVQCQLLLGIQTEFKGAIGKRTKFQQTEHSQLYMEISRDDCDTSRLINEAVQTASTKSLPNDQLCDDELLLDEIAYTDLAPFRRCTIAEQAVLLLQCEMHARSHGRDEHMIEECDAIITAAIGVPEGRSSLWSLVTEALLYRSRSFGKSTRSMEKNMLQMEELSLQYNHTMPKAESRREWFFLSRSWSVWELQTHYGEMLIALSMHRSALSVLTPWDSWKAIIECHTKLGQREKAADAIKERMVIDGESAELLCCLGDVTSDRVLYERAWEVSKRRSARAMRCLACHYLYVDRDHRKALECFELSLSNNVMQIATWSTYGHCCVYLKEYRKAVAAFKHCFTFEPDNYEAWNNCASALIELGELEQALTFLKEGVKYSYENWKVWDNLCIVSANVRDFDTTIKAYHRIIDIQKQHRDPISLSKIVKAVINNTPDWKGEPSAAYRIKLKTLFARIASADGRDPHLFMLQAELLTSDDDQSKTMRERILHCLAKSNHCVSTSGWEKDIRNCKRVLQSVLRLADKAIEYDIDYTSARFAVKSALSVIKNRQSEQLEDLDDEVLRLLSAVEEMDLDLQLRA